jgi:hypothetical protein
MFFVFSLKSTPFNLFHLFEYKEDAGTILQLENGCFGTFQELIFAQRRMAIGFEAIAA